MKKDAETTDSPCIVRSHMHRLLNHRTGYKLILVRGGASEQRKSDKKKNQWKKNAVEVSAQNDDTQVIRI